MRKCLISCLSYTEFSYPILSRHTFDGMLVICDYISFYSTFFSLFPFYFPIIRMFSIPTNFLVIAHLFQFSDFFMTYIFVAPIPTDLFISNKLKTWHKLVELIFVLSAECFRPYTHCRWEKVNKNLYG